MSGSRPTNRVYVGITGNLVTWRGKTLAYDDEPRIEELRAEWHELNRLMAERPYGEVAAWLAERGYPSETNPGDWIE